MQVKGKFIIIAHDSYLQAQPAYKTRLQCPPRMHMCFWEDVYIKQLQRKKIIFVNEGKSLNMLNKGFGNQKNT